MRKTYRLFGIKVWTVETYDPDLDVEEYGCADAGPITATLQLPQDPPPPFGFTPIDFGWETED